MTTRTVRNAAIIALVFLIGACVTLEEIRGTEPVRKVAFTGSFENVAQCVHYRLRGKLSRDPFKKEMSVYDSVKAYQNRGISHYAMTVSQTEGDRGIVEWRKLPEGPMDEAMVYRFWSPVEDCAKQASK